MSDIGFIDTSAPTGADDLLEGLRNKAATASRDRVIATVGSPLFALAGAVDTIGQSLNLIDDDTMANGIGLLSQDAGRVYKNNQSGFRLVGDIGTAIGGAGIAAKALRSGSYLMQALDKAGPTGRGIAAIIGSDTTAVAAMTRKVGQIRAADGAMMLRRESELAKKWRLAARRQQGVNDLKEGIAGELVIAGLQNESELFFPDDQSLSTYGVMTVAGLGLGAGIGQLVLNPALKAAAARAGDAAAASETAVTGNLGTDIVVGVLNAEKARSQDAIKYAIGKPDVIGAMQDAKSTGLLQARNAAVSLGQQKPIADVSVAYDVSQDQVNFVIDTLAKAQPGLVNNMLSIEPANLGKRLETQRPQIRAKLDKQITEVNAQLVSADKNTGEYYQLEAKRRQLVEQSRQVDSGELLGIEVDALGQVHTNYKRQQTILDTRYEVRKQQFTNNKRTVAADEAYLAVPDQAGDRQFYGIKSDGTMVGTPRMRGGAQVSTLRELPTAKGLTVKQVTQVYASMPRALKALEKQLDDVASGNGVPFKTVIDETASYPTLDYIIAAAKKRGGDLNGSMRAMFDFGKFATVNEMKQASLVQKYDAFRTTKLQHQADTRRTAFVAEDWQSYLNLRMTDGYGQTAPAMEWFEDLFASGVKSLKDVSPNGYRDSLASFQRHFIAGAPVKGITEVYGSGGLGKMENMLHLDMVEKFEKPLTPFSIVARRTQNYANTQSGDHALVAKEFEALRQNNLVKNIMSSSNEPMKRALAVLEEQPELMAQIRDGIAKASPGTEATPVFQKLGQLSISTKNFKGRGVHGLSAMATLSDMVQRIANRGLADDMINNSQGIARMRNPKNAVSAQLYGLYETAMQRGWHLADDAVPADGLFKLDADSFVNKKIASDIGLNEVPEFMPNPLFREGDVPLQMDKVALDALKEMRRFDRMLYEVDTAMLRTMGKGPNIAYRRGHSIVPSRYGQEMVFVTDRQGKVVDYVLGATEQESRNKALQAAKQRGPGFGVVGRESVEDYKNLRDEAWNSHYIDVSDSFAKNGPAGGAKRELAVLDGADYARAQLEQVRASFTRQSSRFLEHVFAPEMEQMRYMQHVVKQSKMGLNAKKAGDDVFDLMRQVLTNTNDANEGSLYGALSDFAEQASDAVLDNMRLAMGNLRPAKGNRISAAQAQTIANGMREKFGFDPVDYAARLATTELGGRQDVLTAQKIITKASHLTQTLALKLFETGHGLLTMASLATTLPYSVQMLRAVQGETVAMRKARLGWMADVLPDGSAIPSPTKMLLDTVHDMFNSPDMKAAIKLGKEKGYIDTPIGEFFDVINGAVDGKMAVIANKANEWSGAISTKSEEFARVMSYAVGYKIARTSGNANERMAAAFANDFANKSIADYRPNQRAQVFQGFLGTPLALFQTFSINYFQRMAMAVEGQAYRTLLTQYGTQAFVFGGEAVPGYDLFNETIFSNYDGTIRPSELMAKNPDIGALMQFGTLSNLPKLFGASDGVAFHVRGEMSLPRTLTPLSLSETPAVQMASRMYKALSEGLATLIKEPTTGGFDRMQEALTMTMPNRPLRGLMEVAQGYATNSNGDVIESDTRDLIGVVSRVIGLRPMMEAQKAKALWEDRQTDLAQRERTNHLKQALISNIRQNGPLNSEQALDTMERYVATGGDPQGFRRFYRDALIKATTEKFTREAMKEIKRDPKTKEALKFFRIMESEESAQPVQ